MLGMDTMWYCDGCGEATNGKPGTPNNACKCPGQRPVNTNGQENTNGKRSNKEHSGA